MNYYEHHIGDYDAATAHLSWVEDMAYTRLMRLYYRKEMPVPCDVLEACRLVRAITKEQRRAVDSVLREFFDLRGDGWHQKRCDADVERFQKKAEHNRLVGKLGGRPRKVGTHEEPSNNPSGFCREPKRNPPQSPDTSLQTPEEKIAPAAALLPDVSPQVADDYVKQRKAKLTATAVKGLRREAEKAGLTLQQALEMACERGWRGFKAEWAASDAGLSETAYQRSQREKYERVMPLIAAKAPGPKVYVNPIEVLDAQCARLSHG